MPGHTSVTAAFPPTRLHASRLLRLTSIVFLCSACAAIPLAAQTNTAEIGGVVRDAQGGVLPGATVTALHVSSGFRVARVTDQAGRFFLPALPVGEYVLTVQLDGFRQFAQRGL